MSDDDEKIDLDSVDAETEAMYTQAMRENHRMQNAMRRKAQHCITVANQLDDMAERFRALAAIHLGTARELSDLIFRQLSGEFDITVVPQGEAPDDSEDEDS